MTRLFTAVTIAVLAVLLVTACSDDGGTTAGTTARQATSTTLRVCADPVGRPTKEVVDEHSSVDKPSCIDEAGNVGYAGAYHDCTDGRRLHFDATGWGYSDGVWQAHTRTDGAVNPPDAEAQACVG